MGMTRARLVPLLGRAGFGKVLLLSLPLCG